MSLNTMAQSLILDIPGIPVAKAISLLNEALGLIYDSQMWSWQLKEDGWLTPGLLFPDGPGSSAGTIAVNSYEQTVLGDTVASAAWSVYISAHTRPLFTQLQIRSPYYSLYNIIGVASAAGNSGYNMGGYNQGGYPINGQVQLTLDRPWMEPAGAALSYMIYQCYFPVPVSDFKRFIEARDTTNNAPMSYWGKSRKDLAVEDPERTVFDQPQYFVPYEQDQRTLSATKGSMLYELWPHPLSVLPYTYSYLRRGPLLVLPTDTVPYPLSEEAVMWRAKECACLWREAQKSDEQVRGSGADWRFLSGAAQAEFKTAIKPIKDRDRDLVELYWNKFRPNLLNVGEPFANINGTLNIGR